MFNVAALRAASAPVVSLGTVPWIVQAGTGFDTQLQATPIGLSPDGVIDFDGVGYTLFDCPVYPLSSAQRLRWETGSQQILSMLVSGSDDIDALIASADEDGDSLGGSKIGLVSAMANSAFGIREIHEGMLEAVLRVPHGSSQWIQSAVGLGEPGDDLFAQIFQEVSDLLKPPAKTDSPNEKKAKKTP